MIKLLSIILALGTVVSPPPPVRPDRVTAVEDSIDEIQLPVFMYHRILRHSTGDPYTISPEAFERDLKHLRENGYTAVGSDELIKYAEGSCDLPPKPVVLTFDDGFYNNLYYAEPLLQKYGMKALIFVVGEFSEKSSKENDDNPNYSYIRWEQMENLSDAVEIHSHTWGMHRLDGRRTGIKRKSGESREAYERALRDDLEKLNAEVARLTGKPPAAFAIPFGAGEAWANPVLDELGLKICFCSYEGIATLKRGDPESLRRVKRMVRTPGKSVEVLLKKFETRRAESDKFRPLVRL